MKGTVIDNFLVTVLSWPERLESLLLTFFGNSQLHFL